MHYLHDTTITRSLFLELAKSCIPQHLSNVGFVKFNIRLTPWKLMSREDRWHTPATRQRRYAKRRHAPQVSHSTITHTSHWSTKIIISKWSQALTSGQPNDFTEVRLYYFLDNPGMLRANEAMSSWAQIDFLPCISRKCWRTHTTALIWVNFYESA